MRNSESRRDIDDAGTAKGKVITMNAKSEKQELLFYHTAGQANRFKTHFDSYFTRVMGRGNYGGSAVGECYETASRIVDGDFQSFTDAWRVTAERVEAIGWDCLKKGHRVSARDAFLRATTYWGATTMYASPTDPQYRPSYEKERACFREAAKLFNPQIEVINIPYENGITLPGYFIPGGPAGEKRPTVLVLGGADSALEELYGVVPVGAQRRGYNVLMFEVPGQKAMFFDHPDLFVRPDAEVPVRYAVESSRGRSKKNCFNRCQFRRVFRPQGRCFREAFGSGSRTPGHVGSGWNVPGNAGFGSDKTVSAGFGGTPRHVSIYCEGDCP